jgi:hypothetical protein
MYKVTAKIDGIYFNKHTYPNELRKFCKNIGKCGKHLRSICYKQLIETDEVHCNMMYGFIERYDEELKKHTDKKKK